MLSETRINDLVDDDVFLLLRRDVDILFFLVLSTFPYNNLVDGWLCLNSGEISNELLPNVLHQVEPLIVKLLIGKELIICVIIKIVRVEIERVIAL